MFCNYCIGVVNLFQLIFIEMSERMKQVISERQWFSGTLFCSIHLVPRSHREYNNKMLVKHHCEKQKIGNKDKGVAIKKQNHTMNEAKPHSEFNQSKFNLQLQQSTSEIPEPTYKLTPQQG